MNGRIFYQLGIYSWRFAGWVEIQKGCGATPRNRHQCPQKLKFHKRPAWAAQQFHSWKLCERIIEVLLVPYLIATFPFLFISQILVLLDILWPQPSRECSPSPQPHWKGEREPWIFQAIHSNSASMASNWFTNEHVTSFQLMKESMWAAGLCESFLIS